MEYRWERTFPFLEVSSATIKKLFKGILKECDINNIIPIDSGAGLQIILLNLII